MSAKALRKADLLAAELETIQTTLPLRALALLKDYQLSRLSVPKPEKPKPSADGTKFVEWAIKFLPKSYKLTSYYSAEWARAFDALVKDGYGEAEICKVWKWARQHEFFAKVILSPLKLRETRKGVGILWIASLAGEMERTKPAIPREDGIVIPTL